MPRGVREQVQAILGTGFAYDQDAEVKARAKARVVVDSGCSGLRSLGPQNLKEIVEQTTLPYGVASVE